jgi:hypothetical protein
MSDHYVRSNDEYTLVRYCDHYLHHVVCQITMSDLMITDNTTYTLLYVRSLFQI